MDPLRRGQIVANRLRQVGLYEPANSAHALRYSHAVELYRQKRDIRTVQKQLGHSSIRTTQGYADVLSEDIQEQIRGLWNRGDEWNGGSADISCANKTPGEGSMSGKELSEIIYNYALAAAAFATASVLFSRVWRWFKIWWFRRKYPIQLQNQSWRLIRLPEGAPIYLHHIQQKYKRHIANPATMGDLGFDWNSVSLVSREEYDGIPAGSPINTEMKF